MEPLLLVCPGCGVKIRAANPARARAGNCPRCSTPLASAVEQASRINTDRLGSAPKPPLAETFSVETTPIGDPFSASISCSRWRSRLVVAGGVFVVAASLLNLILLNPSVAPSTGGGGVAPTSHSIASAIRAMPRIPQTDFPTQPEPDSPLATDLEGGFTGDFATEKPVPPPFPVSEAPANFAIRDAEPMVPGPPASSSVPPSASIQFKPVVPSNLTPIGPDELDGPKKVSAPPTPAPPSAQTQPRHLLVRDTKGAAVVAREHGMIKDQMAVVLPDGTIGWPTTQVFTDAPFVPSTIDQMERTLLDGDYATFRVVKTEHYLVFHQSSERFARDSADLLEKLHESLTGALRKKKLPVTPAEFPLVAVIFRSEDDFRSNREVAADGQAYYEILSNRIFFFEKSKKESASPEVSALRKPQTVAHEGTHQVLHNVGIQPRMSPWPLWLVEGLAEYCSPPKTTKRGVAWAGLGQINPIHLTTIRDLEDPMSSEVRGGPQAPHARDRGRPLVEYLATRSDLTPTDYALSWGLTHYLAQNQDRVDQFVAYIRRLNKLRPFETRTPDEQLADFREAFGQDLAKLDVQVGKHLAKLKIPESQALPFYAVLLEQQVSPNAIRRMAMVSQSPSVIRQWVETASNSNGGMVHWEPVACPNRTRAVLTADGWIHQGH